jgi:hypothetical protein
VVVVKRRTGRSVRRRVRLVVCGEDLAISGAVQRLRPGLAVDRRRGELRMEIPGEFDLPAWHDPE